MSDKLSSSLEDYLEALYLIYKRNNTVKAVDIARALGVSRASTTEALKKLADKNLINYGRYDAISITRQGILAAEDVIKKHNSLSDFFEKVLGTKHDEAQEIACKIEHIISKDMLLRIEKFTGYYTKNFGDEFKNKYFS